MLSGLFFGNKRRSEKSTKNKNHLSGDVHVSLCESVERAQEALKVIFHTLHLLSKLALNTIERQGQSRNEFFGQMRCCLRAFMMQFLRVGSSAVEIFTDFFCAASNGLAETRKKLQRETFHES